MGKLRQRVDPEVRTVYEKKKILKILEKLKKHKHFGKKIYVKQLKRNLVCLHVALTLGKSGS